LIYSSYGHIDSISFSNLAVVLFKRHWGKFLIINQLKKTLQLMKFNFTKFGMLVFLFFGVQNLSAQDPNVLTITSPDEVAGNYLIATTGGNWGGVVGSFSGTGTFINDGVGVTTDGCTEAMDNVAGKWAFIDRGECQFADKALTAQNAGAQLAIICNNDSNSPGELPPLGAGDVSDQVTIPVIAINYEDCLRIRVAAEGSDVGVQTRYFCGSPTYPPSVIWGNEPGQGDFNGNIGDWTFENDCAEAGWEFQTNGALPGYTLTEGSACNGFMSFPSWWQSVLGGGTQDIDPRADQYCNGRLFSPNIDLSGETVDGLFCEFWHSTFYFVGGYTQLAVSYDDGVTYPDTMAVSAAVGAGTNIIPPAVEEGCQLLTTPVNDGEIRQFRIPVVGYDNQGQIKLQFIHSGGFYSATIDDVILTNGGQYFDLEVGDTYKTSAPAYRIPLAQAQPVPFHADIINLGNIPAENPELTAEISLNGNIIWSEVNSQFADAPPVSCFLNENFSFEEMFTPSEMGLHTMITRNTTPDDRFTINDDTFNDFEITENTWSSAASDAVRVQMWDGLVADEPGENGWIGFDWAIAYPFFIPNGTGNYLNTLTIGVDPLPTTSGSITTYVYKWVPGLASFPNGARGLAADGRSPSGTDYLIHPDDTQLVGICAEVFGQQRTTIPLNSSLQGDFDFENITMKIGQANRATGELETDNLGTPLPLELEDETQYVLVFAITPSDDEEINFQAVDAADGTRYFQGATNYAYAYNESFIRSDAFVATLDNDGDFETEIEQLVFDRSIGATANMPWLEMNIGALPTSTEDLTEAAGQSIRIFPNPVIDQINVEVNLDETSDVVSFELMDINGKIVKTETFNDVMTANLTMGVKDVVPGVYTLNVRSEAGFTAKKVIVQK